MHLRQLPLESESDTVLARLEEAGIGFTVVCSGPEPACPDWQTCRAA